jgi:hypothetical protein
LEHEQNLGAGMNWMVLNAPSWQRLRAILVTAIASAFTAAKFAFYRARRRWRKPGFKTRFFGTIAWALFIVLYGLIVGFAAALFPPMVSLALAAVTIPFLFWCLPDVRTVYEDALRKSFFAAVTVYFCFPTYYMVQIPGLPWLSIRRIVISVVIGLTLYTLSTSKPERASIAKTLSGIPLLRLCIIGFYCMAVFSIAFSSEPATSLSRLTEVTLNWYVPFFSCLMVIRSEEQSDRLFKTLAVMSLFVSALGFFDYVLEKNLALEAIPKAILNVMMENNQSFADMVNTNPYRDGAYRAYSIYNTALSYGEFGAMLGPIGVYYIIHGKRVSERLLGWAVLAGAVVTVTVSGSRGGALGLLVAAPMMVGLWTIRFTSKNPFSMVGPIAVAVAGLGAAATGALVFAWPKLNKMVVGGGAAQSSTESRYEQGRLAWEQVRTNPIFGHGLARAGDVIGFFNPGGGSSVDSSVFTFAVETGVPGLLFYFGMILIPTYILARIYLTDKSPRAEIAAPLACSFVAYGIYRLFLSQIENQTLFFIFLALTFVIANASRVRLAANRPGAA